jgi:hypothetical protein
VDHLGDPKDPGHMAFTLWIHDEDLWGGEKFIKIYKILKFSEKIE